MFGLELMDLLALAVCFIVVFNVSDHLVLNALALAAIYGGMRHFKKDKPQGYLISLLRFLIRGGRSTVSLEDLARPYPRKKA